MGGIDDCSQSFLAHMGVVLSRRKIRMTEQFLDGTKISSAIKEMRGKGMTQSMGVRR
jgi:hypothetical protein